MAPRRARAWAPGKSMSSCAGRARCDARAPARADRGAHGSRDLHRLRHPGLPRAEWCVDEEPGSGKGGDDPALPGRPGRAGAGPGRHAIDSPAWTARPNAGHQALVELERRGKLHAIITQNVDELHQRAGSSARAGDRGPRHHAPRHVLGLRRGGADGARPSRGCGRARTTRRAASCGGVLKSATISFGQSLVPEVIDRALTWPRRPTCSSPSAPACGLPGGQHRAPGPAGRRQGRHRERRADAATTTSPTPSCAVRSARSCRPITVRSAGEVGDAPTCARSCRSTPSRRRRAAPSRGWPRCRRR